MKKADKILKKLIYKNTRFEEIMPNLYLFIFESRTVMNSQLTRPMMAHESDEFRGRPFTIEEFKMSWTKKHGNYNFDNSWDGLNFPSSILKGFRDGSFKDVTPGEQFLMDKVPEDVDGYIITLHENSPIEVKFHEILHGMYYLNKDYRDEVNDVIRKYDNVKIIEHLKNIGYGDANLLDEINSYQTTMPEYVRFFNIHNSSMEDELVDLYNKYKDLYDY